MDSLLPDIAHLAGKRVALWGWGREGRAAWQAIRSRVPALPLTVLCSEAEAVDVQALNDAHTQASSAISADALSAFNVVVKSPGISPYTPEAQEATSRGTRFIGGTALWFAEHAGEQTYCVTGTKGKSTTSALFAHLLRVSGKRTALAGNIGLPLLELQDARADAWVIELSSYQTCDVAASGVHPKLAIVTNVFPEHLDWHGSESRYVEDKLALLTQAKPGIAVLNAGDRRLASLHLPQSKLRWYNHAGGWHMRGDFLYRNNLRLLDTHEMPLPGAHNRGNLCAVLEALEALGHDAEALAPHAATFQPLPNRLQPLGTHDGVLWVNDSISTTPHATLAALEVFADQPVAVLVGGHDRGLDWQVFANAMTHRAPRAVITMGQNGPRIHALLEPLAKAHDFALHAASDLEDATRIGVKSLGKKGGVLLLSPGAPSFGAYRDYVARGKHFADLGGFDPDLITSIAGLGIA